MSREGFFAKMNWIMTFHLIEHAREINFIIIADSDLNRIGELVGIKRRYFGLELASRYRKRLLKKFRQ